MTEKMLSRKEDGVGYLIFNNPERHNAMSFEMWEGTRDMLAELAVDRDVRVVVLAGAGGKTFVSGADVSDFDKHQSNEAQTDRYNSLIDEVFRALYELPKPTIAMIRGYCIGGGVGLAACCDLRICSEGSRFGIPAAKLGLGYGYAGVKRLVDLVGPAFCKEIFFTARQFDAEEARRMGLVNRVVPAAELESFVKSYTDMICSNAPLAIHAVKVAVGEALKEDSRRDPGRCAELVKKCLDSEDYAEGRKAFLEKRKPSFTGS